MSLISLVQVEENNLKEAIAKTLNLLHYSFRADLKRIVIKINACYYWDYSTGQTTDPKFVASLIELIRESISNDVDIVLVESDASAMKCKHAYKFLGYEKLSKQYGVRLVNLSEEKSSNVTVKCNNKTYQFSVPDIIRDADLRINIPKIKYTMKDIELTCALKNIFGCNPYPLKYKYHKDLGNVIVALNKAMPFDLCIVDGNIVSGMSPRKLGLVMASEDKVAIDVAAARIAGLNPAKIKYLLLAAREGIGNFDYSIKGESLDHYRALYPKKNFEKKLMGTAYVLITRLKLAKRLGLG